MKKATPEPNSLASGVGQGQNGVMTVTAAGLTPPSPTLLSYAPGHWLPLIDADRRWLRSMRDAMLLGLAAIAANLYARAILEICAYRGTQPYLQAATAIVPWVLNGAAVWLLTRRNPENSGDANIERLVLRWMVISTGLGVALLHDSGNWAPLSIHMFGDFVVCLLSLPVSFLFFLRLRRLAVALDRPSLRRQTAMCAAAVPLAGTLTYLLAWDLGLVERSWIVTTLTLRPQPIAGSPAMFPGVPIEWYRWGTLRLTPHEVTFVPIAVVTCLVGAVLIQFLFRLNRVLRLQARIGGSIASSSPP